MAAAMTLPGKGFNPFGRAWTAYERSLRRHPILTQAASSALLWGFGDAMAQRIEKRGKDGIDARRVALTAAFGGAVIGPAGHGWYLMLERLVVQLGLACSLKSMLLKVTADNLLYSPCYLLAFFAYGCMAIDGISPAAFVDKVREDFMPTMLAEALLWPPYMAFVFSRVPVKHQLLAVNIATLFDVCFLSWVRTRNVVAEEAGAAQESAATLETRVKDGHAELSSRVEKATSKGNQEKLEQQQQLESMGEREFDELATKDLAAIFWPWDAATDDNLSRIALMAASATCSSVGGGSTLGAWSPAVLPGASAVSLSMSMTRFD